MSLLTGELFINLDFHKNVAKAELIKRMVSMFFPTGSRHNLWTLKSDFPTLFGPIIGYTFEDFCEKFQGGLVGYDEDVPFISPKGGRKNSTVVFQRGVTPPGWKG